MEIEQIVFHQYYLIVLECRWFDCTVFSKDCFVSVFVESLPAESEVKIIWIQSFYMLKYNNLYRAKRNSTKYMLSGRTCNRHMSCFWSKIPAYPQSAPNTNMIQLTIQAVSALNPSTLGDLVETKLKILISTKNSVTNNVIRPGITSGGIKKLTFEEPK